MQSNNCWRRGRGITSLGLLATLTNTAQDTVGRLCCKGTLLLVFDLLFIGTPKSFTAEHLPGQLAPSLYCCRVTPSQMEGLKLAFGEYLKNPVSPFFQPGQVPLNSSLALLHFDHSSPFSHPQNSFLRIWKSSRTKSKDLSQYIPTGTLAEDQQWNF